MTGAPSRRVMAQAIGNSSDAFLQALNNIVSTRPDLASDLNVAAIQARPELASQIGQITGVSAAGGGTAGGSGFAGLGSTAIAVGSAAAAGAVVIASTGSAGNQNDNRETASASVATNNRLDSAAAAGADAEDAKIAGAEAADVRTADTEAVGAETTGADATGAKTTSAEPADTKAPGGDTTDVKTPGGDTADVKAPGGDTADVKAPGGDTTDVKAPGGDTADVKTPGGDTTDVKAPGGDTTGVEPNDEEIISRDFASKKAPRNDITDEAETAETAIDLTPKVSARFVEATLIEADISRLVMGYAFGDALGTALSGVAMDGISSSGEIRPYNLSDFAQASDAGFDSRGALLRFGMPSRRQTVALDDATSLTWTMKDGGSASAVTSLESARDGNTLVDKLESARFTRSLGSSRITVTHGDTGGDGLGLRGDDRLALDTRIQSEAFLSPYLGFVGRGWGLMQDSDLTADGLSLRVGTFTGSVDSDDTGNGAAGGSRGFGTVAEITQAWGDRSRVGVEVGVIGESDRVLGSELTGSFAVGRHVQTGYVGLNTDMAITPTLSVQAVGHVGLTRVGAADGSLITDIRPIRTESFSLGLTGTDVMAARDSVSATLHQPLRVGAGSLDLRTGTGAVTGLNLKPSGREIDYELTYTRRLVGDSALSVGAMLRTEPGHRADADPDGVFLMRFRHGY